MLDACVLKANIFTRKNNLQYFVMSPVRFFCCYYKCIPGKDKIYIINRLYNIQIF